MNNVQKTAVLVADGFPYSPKFMTKFPGGKGTTKPLSKVILNKEQSCLRETMNTLFTVADPFSKGKLQKKKRSQTLLVLCMYMHARIGEMLVFLVNHNLTLFTKQYLASSSILRLFLRKHFLAQLLQ